MNHNQTEIEAKFYIQNLSQVEKHLIDLGAKITHPRVFEINLRFDTPERSLSTQHRVLRLRQDERSRLTYKGPSQPGQQVGTREEIEFEVSSFADAKDFLNALGYDVVMMYEKYRTTYQLDTVEIMLDEMPYGQFLEIEGSHADEIWNAAQKLNLKWDSRCAVSYMELFERLRISKNLLMPFLTFEAFSGLTFMPSDFQITPAD